MKWNGSLRMKRQGELDFDKEDLWEEVLDALKKANIYLLFKCGGFFSDKIILSYLIIL